MRALALILLGCASLPYPKNVEQSAAIGHIECMRVFGCKSAFADRDCREQSEAECVNAGLPADCYIDDMLLFEHGSDARRCR